MKEPDWPCSCGGCAVLAILLIILLALMAISASLPPVVVFI